jgi:hypothetical protein
MLYPTYPAAGGTSHVTAHLLGLIVLSSGTQLHVLQYPLGNPICHYLPVAKHPFVNSSPSCKQPGMTQGARHYENPWLNIVKCCVETL